MPATRILSDVCGNRGVMALAVLGFLLSLLGLGLLSSLTLTTFGEEAASAREALELNKELEFSAIQAILRHLDDNADGSVDHYESEEFVQMELKEPAERSHKFHETDSQITSEDLWLSWQQNEVFYWTNSDVIQWLVQVVSLPQYERIFRKFNVTGRHLPRIANNSGQVLQNVLGITDPQHKQKIQLRAMDSVLFGPPAAKSSLWKDVAVVLSSSLCLAGLIYALKQRKSVRSRIDFFLDSIQEKERELKALQEKLDQQKSNCEPDSRSSPPSDPSPSPSNSDEDEGIQASFSSRSSSCDTTLTRAQEAIEELKCQVVSLSSQLASSQSNHRLLHELLLETCLSERDHVERRRREAQEEIGRAQKVCDKVKRRRSSLFGTFHLANSSALEEAGMQITRAVNKMQKVSLSYEEFHQRWRSIEQACSFNIISVHPHHPSSSYTAFPSSSSFSSFSLPPNVSLLSLDSMDLADSDGTDSLCVCTDQPSHSRSAVSCSDSPRSSLKRRPSGGSLREGELSVSTGAYLRRQPRVTSSLPPSNARQSSLPPSTFTQQNSLPPSSARQNSTHTRQSSLPPLLASTTRQDSYSEAISRSSLISLDGAGISFSATNTPRTGGRREGGGGGGGRGGGKGSGGGRKHSLTRQGSLGSFSLGAVHEEQVERERPTPDSGEDTRPGSIPGSHSSSVLPSCGEEARSGSTIRINSNSSHSTV